ncbi:GNAT family N-acetyltransferase [Macrococcus sp. EM39E]|uniref:GNAT family N-acetyltransferase n=1 Tax=Macrococcus animalis TaxID=3395467 RepID=UPI0039BEBFF8
MEIRQATYEDLKEIIHTTQLAFENEEMSDNQEHKLVEELMQSDSYIAELSVVALVGDTIVGHIMYSKIKINENNGLAMAPLSIHPDYQKQGIGTALMTYTLSKIPIDQPIVILGHPSYYTKFGFIPASTYNIKPPFDVPDNVFMVRASEEVKNKGIQGTVIYDDAFL